MLVDIPQTLYVSEHYQLGRYGQIALSVNDRLMQPTNVYAPSARPLHRAITAKNSGSCDAVACSAQAR